MKLRTGDFFVIAFIVVLAISIRIFLVSGQAEGERIRIERDGKLIYEEPLHQEKVIRLDECTVEIKDGKVRITDSTCPDKTCIKTGTISKEGETIVCVPNRISISTGGKGDADVIAG